MTEPMTTRTRARENAPGDQTMATPKNGKKAISEPVPNVPSLVPVNLEMQPFVMPLTTLTEPPREPLIDEDAKSNATDQTNKTIKSTTSSARIRKLEQERDAKRRLREIETELLQKEREALLEELELNKAIAAEQQNNEDLELPDEPLMSPVAPPADRNARIENWVQNEPLIQAEHP